MQAHYGKQKYYFYNNIENSKIVVLPKYHKQSQVIEFNFLYMSKNQLKYDLAKKYFIVWNIFKDWVCHMNYFVDLSDI